MPILELISSMGDHLSEKTLPRLPAWLFILKR